MKDALLTAYKPVAQTFTDSAEQEAQTKFGSLVVYDPLAAAGQIAGAQQTFIGAIQGQAADVVRAQILDAVRNGADPQEAADALQAVIGLTPRQAQAVSNFRSLLENGDSSALSRALRDKRFDSTVARAISGETSLTEDQIDAMVTRYAERSLASRALTIARNESINAATGGIRDAYVQAVQTGRLMASEVSRKWQIVFDERTCAICASIPLMNPNGVGVLQPYLSIVGPVLALGVHTTAAAANATPPGDPAVLTLRTGGLMFDIRDYRKPKPENVNAPPFSLPTPDELKPRRPSSPVRQVRKDHPHQHQAGHRDGAG